MAEIIRIINAIINNLNGVEVRGQNNLALLYNSIDALRSLKHSLENPVKTEEKIDVGASTEENKAE